MKIQVTFRKRPWYIKADEHTSQLKRTHINFIQ